MLDLARKLIILDIHAIEAAKIASLALTLVALGAVYWLKRERDAWNMAGEKRAKTYCPDDRSPTCLSIRPLTRSCAVCAR